MLGGIGGRRRGRQRMRWLDGITDSMDMSLSNSGSWWWTGRPGVLWFMRSQRVGHDWATELNWTELSLSPMLFVSLLSSPVYKVFSDNHFASCFYFSLFLWVVLFPASCTMLWTSVRISSALCLLDLILWTCLSPPLYNHREFEVSHTWLASWFTLSLV